MHVFSCDATCDALWVEANSSACIAFCFCCHFLPFEASSVSTGLRPHITILEKRMGVSVRSRPARCFTAAGRIDILGVISLEIIITRYISPFWIGDEVPYKAFITKCYLVPIQNLLTATRTEANTRRSVSPNSHVPVKARQPFLQARKLAR